MKIQDKIKIPNMGFMGLEDWIGTIVGTTKDYYIIDFGENTIVEQRFQIRPRGYEIK
tara:strand:- start:457 stop:627 length:171 start_codon:yes stop_codon:yes gene_type:complete